MAPFKLKFRMGSSRSTSQDTDNSEHSATGVTGGVHSSAAAENDAQLQPLLQRSMRGSSATISRVASSATLDSANFVGSGSSSADTVDGSSFADTPLLANHQQPNALGNRSAGSRNGGYSNPAAVADADCDFLSGALPPQSPPPSYEHVLEENRRANLDKDNNPIAASTSAQSLHRAAPAARPATVNVVENGLAARLNGEQPPEGADRLDNCQHQAQANGAQRRNGNAMSTTPSLDDGEHASNANAPAFGNSATLLCDNHQAPEAAASVLIGGRRCGDSSAIRPGAYSNNNECAFGDLELDTFADNDNAPDGNRAGARCDAADDEREEDIDDDDDWHSHQEQYQRQQQQLAEQMAQTPDTIINNKSSKEIYKAVAEQWGITCKMSEHCRCMGCQSNYFDCEYEENENQKSDGGLGAGTPMFISEVMHGSACSIL